MIKFLFWFLAAATLALALPPVAFSQTVPHPHHGRDHFYATWMMPDARHASCCSNEDCAPAQARVVDGKWQARYADNTPWVEIPPHKVEHERDMPDSQAHLCGRYAEDGTFVVLCFGAGAGG